MLALVLAMISLSNIDPDPVVTPAPVIHDRLPSATGFASGAPAATNSLDIAVESCSYGAQQLGRDAWQNANVLGSMLAMPACSAYGSGPRASSAFGFGFGSPFGAFPVSGPVRFVPAPRSSGTGGSAAVAAPGVGVPAGVVRPLPVLHEPSAGSVRVLPRSLPVAAPLRRH